MKESTARRGPWWLRPLSFVSPLWEYRVHYYGRRSWKSRPELAAQAGLDAGIVAELAVELGDRVFECAYRRAPEAEEAVFAEGKRAVTAYLREHAR